MDFLRQKRYFSNRSIEFLEEGISYSHGNLISSKQAIISYEEIQHEKQLREFKLNKFNMWVCIFAGLTMIKSIAGFIENPNGMAKGLLPLASIFFIVFLITTLLSRRRLLYIPTYSSGVIELYDNNPSYVDIQEFLKELKSRTNNFLKRKYGAIDKDLPTDGQLEVLSWLRQRNVLDESEFDLLKQQLIGSKPEVKGFNRN